MSARRERFIRPTFDGEFVLVDADVAVAEMGDRYIGPFVAAAAYYDADDATVFVGDGLPFRIGVVAQDNDVLTLHDSSRFRIVPWPICTSSQRDTDPLHRLVREPH